MSTAAPANGLSAEANALVAYGKIQTASGRFIQPFALDPELVDIDDIAHALAHQCRFSGHIQQFYSVAQHSVAVSELAPTLMSVDAAEFLERGEWVGAPDRIRRTALEGLLHDSTEAYLIDLPRPVKHQPVMQPYRDAEDRAWRVIAKKYGLPETLSDVVHQADNLQLEVEARSLLLPPPSWAAAVGPVIDRAWSPEEAKLRFLRRFYQLQSK